MDLHTRQLLEELERALAGIGDAVHTLRRRVRDMLRDSPPDTTPPPIRSPR